MGWNDRSSTSSTLPSLTEHKQLRFREPQEAVRQGDASRRVSRLPTVQRKNSLMAFEPMVAKFVKNGDRFFQGVQLNISPRVIRSWEVLLAELSHRIDLPAGVRKIYTPESGHRVNSLSELQHQKVYVCASTEPFKRIDYTKVKNPDWKMTRSRLSESVPPSIFSSNFPLVPVDVATGYKSTTVSGDVAEDSFEASSNKSRPRRISRIRRPSRPIRLSSINDGDLSFFPSSDSNATSTHPLSPTTSNANKPVAITIYQNGPPPRYNVLVYLNREVIQSWEDAKRLIKENLPNSNSFLRLYRPDGDEVQSLSQLWRAGSILIAAGREKFNIADFMMGAGGMYGLHGMLINRVSSKLSQAEPQLCCPAYHAYIANLILDSVPPPLAT